MFLPSKIPESLEGHKFKVALGYRSYLQILETSTSKKPKLPYLATLQKVLTTKLRNSLPVHHKPQSKQKQQ